MNQIILYRLGNSWMADHKGPHKDQIFSLFSTTVLPTPFTAQCSPGYVLSELRRLNPGVDVQLRNEGN